MIYVMSDIHGCFEEFLEMLKLINFSFEEDELFIIGDVVDRGPKPIQLLQYIMKQERIYLLMGNHEKMMLESLIPPDFTEEEREDLRYSPELIRNRNLWLGSNGGNSTAKEYNRLTGKEQKDIYVFLDNLELFRTLEVKGVQYLLIHGGPGRNLVWPMEQNGDASVILWDRIDRSELDADLVPGYHLIVGHTPTIYYGNKFAGKIIKARNKYLIDCGCVFGYSLGCLCLDTLDMFYVRRK